MKKILFYGILFIITGFCLGNMFFNRFNSFLLPTKNIYYVLEEGVYLDKESLQNNIQNIKQKIVDYHNNQYYVYLGVTKDIEVFNKLKSIYDKKGIRTIKKEKEFISEEFLANVNQFDLLIKETTDDEQILTIEEVVLANYEEIFKKK